jgi:hypothetical protein
MLDDFNENLNRSGRISTDRASDANRGLNEYI